MVPPLVNKTFFRLAFKAWADATGTIVKLSNNTKFRGQRLQRGHRDKCKGHYKGV
jgi:hypothetical protein